MRGLYVLSFALTVLACDTSCDFTQNPLLYNGNVNKDVYGRDCDLWNFTDATQGIDPSHNLCRLWSGSTELVPWCYVGNYAKLSFCDTGSFVCPLCENPPAPPTPKPVLSLPCHLPPTPRLDPRVVGGAQVTNYQYPFFASIYLALDSRRFLHIGGTLIHPNYVLSAWFDLSQLPPIPIQNVYLGARSVQPGQIPDRQCFETHPFARSQVHCHPLGSGDIGAGHSYCLIRLTTASKYTPIRLLTPEAAAYLGEDLEAVPLMLTILGLGSSTYAQETQQFVLTFLHKAYMPVADFTTCATSYQQYNGDDLQADTQLCGGYAHNPQNDSSYGEALSSDFGGPVFTHRKGEYWQVGVIGSFGQQIDCITGNLVPAVWSRINSQSFRDWVCSTLAPTKGPTVRPTKGPTRTPTHRPTKIPTNRPTKRPTGSPVTRSPTHAPTRRPTRSPSLTKPPTNQPTKKPTKSPTMRPTKKPTHNPTTRSPSRSPSTRGPTLGRPTRMPTERPTKRPTKSPATRSPTKSPTTRSPTNRPSKRPTKSPSTRSPTRSPTTRSPTSPPRPLCSYLFPSFA